MNRRALLLLPLLLLGCGRHASRPPAPTGPIVTSAPETVRERHWWRIVTAASFSPDGKLLLTGYQVDDNLGVLDPTRLLVLWDVESGRVVRAFHGHERRVDFVRFLPGGKQAVSAGWDGTFKLWDVGTGQEVASVLPYRKDSYLPSPGLSPDGKLLVTWGAAEGEGPEFKLWALPEGTLLKRFDGRRAAVRSIVVSPDNKRALLSCQLTPRTSGGIKLLDLDTGAILRSFEQDEGWGEWADFAPDGKLALLARRNLARGNGDELVFWDLTEGRPAAAQALRWIGPGTEPAARALREALLDAHPDVRDLAQEGLRGKRRWITSTVPPGAWAPTGPALRDPPPAPLGPVP